MLALSAGVYSTYYVVRDEQSSGEDVVDVVEKIESPVVLKEAPKIPLLVSSTSGTVSGVDVINAKSSTEDNDSVTATYVAKEEVIVKLESGSDNQKDSVLPDTKEPKDNASETTIKPDASLPEPSSDLRPKPENVEIGNSESSDLLVAHTNKKEEEIKCEASDSPDAKLLSGRIESNGSNSVLGSTNQIEKSISGQSFHSDDTVVINDQTSQTTDLHVEQVQDIQVEIESSVSASVVPGENVIVVEGEEFDMSEVFKAMDIGKGLSWGSSDAVSRKELIHEDGPKPELPTKDNEEETGSGGGVFEWIGSWFI